MFVLLILYGVPMSHFSSSAQGVRTTFSSQPTERHTLEKLVQSEADLSNKHGTASLRRLLRYEAQLPFFTIHAHFFLRGLMFTCRALQNARANPQEEKLQPSFSRAYDAVLRHHHGFAIRTVVQVAMRACPYRRDFYSRIAQGGSQEKLDEELDRWLAGLDVIVVRMADFYEKGGHGKI